VIPTATDTVEEERERIVARRKKQIWLMAAIMTGSFCIGTSTLCLVLWLIIK
jgi:hypothetical protein